MDITFRVGLCDVGHWARLADQMSAFSTLIGEGETMYLAIASLCEELHRGTSLQESHRETNHPAWVMDGHKFCPECGEKL